MASISRGLTGMGLFPKPTTRTTPGIVRIGGRFSGSNRQKRYPGNSGTCKTLIRSDQRRRAQNIGRNSSNPLYRSAHETARSNCEFTPIANQGRFGKLKKQLRTTALISLENRTVPGDHPEP